MVRYSMEKRRCTQCTPWAAAGNGRAAGSTTGVDIDVVVAATAVTARPRTIRSPRETIERNLVFRRGGARDRGGLVIIRIAIRCRARLFHHLQIVGLVEWSDAERMVRKERKEARREKEKGKRNVNS